MDFVEDYPPEDTTSLTLDTQRLQAKELFKILAEYRQLKSLSMANCGLTSMVGFPSLPQLRKVQRHITPASIY